MKVQSLGYVIVETQKRAEWEKFMTQLVGAMQVPTDEKGVSLFRIDERPFRFRIVESNRDWLKAAGLEVKTRADLEALAQDVEAAGRPVRWGTPVETEARQVAAFFATSDPAENGLEFFYGAKTEDSRFVSPLGISHFVTGPQGLGHAVFGAPDFRSVYGFYHDVVGLRDSDMPVMHVPGGPPDGMHFAFLYGETGRHHCIALGEGPVPKAGGAIHVMVELPDMLEVGLAHDRMLQLGYKESATIGQHWNDETTGFYVKTPSGFDLEIGHGSLVVDPATWETTHHKGISKWGHHWAWQAELKKAREQQ